MFFVIGCGGSDGGNSSSGGYGNGGYGDGGYSGGSSSECSSGDYECDGNESYYCSGGFWTYNEYCSYGCSSLTGRCKNSSGSGSSSSDESSSECEYGDYKCEDGDSYKCSAVGTWKLNKTCSYGCDYSTGKCNSSSSSGSDSGSSQNECDYGEYRCSYGYSQKCSNGKWVDDRACQGVGCNNETGKCKTADEIKPCPPKLSGSVSGNLVKLSWSYPTSSGCGTPTTATLKYRDNDYDTWVEIKSASASSFTSYTLSVSDYGYYRESAEQWILQAGVLVENEADSIGVSCWCFIDDGYCSCT